MATQVVVTHRQRDRSFYLGMAGLRLQTWSVDFVVPDHHGFLLLQQFHITRRLMAGSINGILFVDRSHRNLVVVVGGDLFRRTNWVGERHLERGKRRVIPSFGNRLRGGARLLGPCILAHGLDADQEHAQC